MTNLAQVLEAAVSGTGLAEVRKAEATSNRVRLVMRVQNTALKAWLAVIKHVLSQPSEHYGLHICKHYFMMGSSLVYGWEVVLAAVQAHADLFEGSVRKVAEAFATAAKTAPTNRYQLEEFPLVGASADRNAPSQPFNPASGKGQRGAHRIGG